MSKGEDSLCLPNGVRNADRNPLAVIPSSGTVSQWASVGQGKFISNNGGFNMSISLFEGAWPSSEVLTYMLKCPVKLSFNMSHL